MRTFAPTKQPAPTEEIKKRPAPPSVGHRVDHVLQLRLATGSFAAGQLSHANSQERGRDDAGRESWADSSHGPARTLPYRAQMESAFGADFSSVRVRPGRGAALNALGANAATAGEDVAFADDRPGPALVAHELAHVLQQRRGDLPSGAAGVVDSSSLEAEADAASRAAVAGRQVPSRHGAGAPPSAGSGAVQLDKKKTPSPILYVGMTENAPKEIKKLKEVNKDRGGVLAITTTDPQDVLVEGGTTFDLTTDAGVDAFAKTLSLDAGVEKQVADLLKAQGAKGKDELASIVKVYAATEADPATPRMTRMVLSGHSGGMSTFGVGGRITFDTFVTLAQIFPKAAGQVEHLHMSGCSTGGESTMEDYYLKAFPKVKTIWGYAGACPTNSGAVSAQENWEAQTDTPGVKSLKREAGVAVWGEGGYKGGEPMDLTAALARVSLAESTFTDYFNGTKVDKDPESGALTDYYRMVVRVAGRGGLDAADKKRLRERAQVALRLRFYTNVRGHFMKTHGTTIQAGYDELKLKAPDYANLPRKDALKAIADFATAAAGNTGQAAKALELLGKGLRDLAPNVIDESWIL